MQHTTPPLLIHHRLLTILWVRPFIFSRSPFRSKQAFPNSLLFQSHWLIRTCSTVSLSKSPLTEEGRCSTWWYPAQYWALVEWKGLCFPYQWQRSYLLRRKCEQKSTHMLNIPNRPCFRISVANTGALSNSQFRHICILLAVWNYILQLQSEQEVVNRMKMEWLCLTPACFSLWAKLLFVWRCQRAGNIVSVPPVAVSEPLGPCELTHPRPRRAEKDRAYPWRPRWGHFQRCPISGDKRRNFEF